jgi:hypothetical protein
MIFVASVPTMEPQLDSFENNSISGILSQIDTLDIPPCKIEEIVLVNSTDQEFTEEELKKIHEFRIPVKYYNLNNSPKAELSHYLACKQICIFAKYIDYQLAEILQQFPDMISGKKTRDRNLKGETGYITLIEDVNRFLEICRISDYYIHSNEMNLSLLFKVNNRDVKENILKDLYKIVATPEIAELELKNNSRILFKGNDIELFKIMMKVLLKDKYCLPINLHLGLPPLDPTWDGYIFYNFSNLKYSDQRMLLEELQKKEYENKYIIFQIGEDHPIYLNIYEEIKLPGYLDIQAAISLIFTYMLIEADLFRTGFETIEPLIKENRLKYFLKEVNSINQLKFAINKIEAYPQKLFFLRSNFLYDFEQEIIKFKKESLMPPLESLSLPKYIWRKNDITWDVNLGMESPVQISDIKGAYFIAAFIDSYNQLKPVSMMEIWTTVMDEPEKDYEEAFHIIKESINRVIEEIRGKNLPDKRLLKFVQSIKILKRAKKYFPNLPDTFFSNTEYFMFLAPNEVIIWDSVTLVKFNDGKKKKREKFKK